MPQVCSIKEEKKRKKKIEPGKMWRFNFQMCDSRKYPYCPHGGSLEIFLRRRTLKGQVFEAKLEFIFGLRVQNKNPWGRGEYG